MNHGMSKEGYGRPVLMDCHPSYETLEGTEMMVAIPCNQFFGASTYFNGIQMFSSTIGFIEYDSLRNPFPICRTSWREFHDADDETLMKHLQNDMVSERFRKLATRLINEIKY